MEEVVIEDNRGNDPGEIFGGVLKFLNQQIQSDVPLSDLNAFDVQIAKLNDQDVKSYLAQNMHKFDELKIALEQFRQKVAEPQQDNSHIKNISLMNQTMIAFTYLEQELKQHPNFIIASAYQQLHELSQAKQKVEYWEARQGKRPLKAPERIIHYNAEVARLDRPFDANLPSEMKRNLATDKQIMARLSIIESQMTDINKNIATWTKRQNMMPNKAAANLTLLNSSLNEQQIELEKTIKLMSPQGLQQNIRIVDKQIQQAEAKLNQWSESKRPIKARQKVAFYTKQLENLKAQKENFMNTLPQQDDLQSSVQVAVAVNPGLEALRAIHDNGRSDLEQDVVGAPESDIESESAEKDSQEMISPDKTSQTEFAQSSPPVHVQSELVIDRNLNAIATLMKDLPRKNKDFSEVENISAVVNNFAYVLQNELDALTQQVMINPQNASQVIDVMNKIRVDVINWISDLCKVDKYQQQSINTAQRLKGDLFILIEKCSAAIEDVQIFNPANNEDAIHTLQESEASEISNEQKMSDDRRLNQGVEAVIQVSQQPVKNDSIQSVEGVQNSKMNEIVQNISRYMAELPRDKKDFSQVENLSAVVNNFSLFLQRELNALAELAMINPQNASQVVSAMNELRGDVMKWIGDLSKVEKFQNQSTNDAERLHKAVNALTGFVTSAIEDVEIFKNDNKSDMSHSKSAPQIPISVHSTFREVAEQQLREKKNEVSSDPDKSDISNEEEGKATPKSGS